MHTLHTYKLSYQMVRPTWIKPGRADSDNPASKYLNAGSSASKYLDAGCLDTGSCVQKSRPGFIHAGWDLSFVLLSANPWLYHWTLVYWVLIGSLWYWREMASPPRRPEVCVCVLSTPVLYVLWTLLWCKFLFSNASSHVFHGHVRVRPLAFFSFHPYKGVRQ